MCIMGDPAPQEAKEAAKQKVRDQNITDLTNAKTKKDTAKVPDPSES